MFKGAVRPRYVGDRHFATGDEPKDVLITGGIFDLTAVASAKQRIARQLKRVRASTMSNFDTGKDAAEKKKKKPIRRTVAEGLVTEIMMEIKQSDLNKLQACFEANGELSLEQFVVVMMRYLSYDITTDNAKKVVIANLSDLFQEIDVDGDGQIPWEEFLTFLVDQGTVKDDYTISEEGLTPYLDRNWVDPNMHCTIEGVKKFTDWRQCCIWESNHVVRLYSHSNMELVNEFQAPHSIVTAENQAHRKTLFLSTSARTLMEYDVVANHVILRKSAQMPEIQTSLTYSEEFETLFGGSISGDLSFIDTKTLVSKLTVSGHDKTITAVQPLESMGMVATASLDATVRIFDVVTSQWRNTLRGHKKGVSEVTLSSDYHLIFSAGLDRECLVWNPFVTNLVARLQGHQSPLIAVDVVPGTPQLLTADAQGYVKLWDIRSFSCIQTFQAAGSRSLVGISTSKEDKNLVSISAFDMCLFSCSVQVNPTLTDEHPITCTLFNERAGSFLVISGRNCKVFDAKFGKLIKIFRNIMPHEITVACLDQRRRRFVLGDHHGNICIFNYNNGALMTTLTPHEAEVTGLSFIAHDSMVISSSWDGHILVHNYTERATPFAEKDLNAHRGEILSMQVSPTLNLIASGGSDRCIRVLDSTRFQTEGICVHPEMHAIRFLRFCSPKPLLAAVDEHSNIFVWGVRPASVKHMVVASMMHQEWDDDMAFNVESIAWTPDGERLLIGTDTGSVVVIEFTNIFQSENESRGGGGKNSLLPAISSRITKPTLPAAIPAAAKKLQRVNTVRSMAYLPINMGKAGLLTVERTFEAHDAAIRYIEPSNLHTCVTASADCMVKLWSLASGRLIGVFIQGDQYRPWNFPFMNSMHKHQEVELQDQLDQLVARIGSVHVNTVGNDSDSEKEEIVSAREFKPPSGSQTARMFYKTSTMKQRAEGSGHEVERPLTDRRGRPRAVESGLMSRLLNSQKDGTVAQRTAVFRTLDLARKPPPQ